MKATMSMVWLGLSCSAFSSSGWKITKRSFSNSYPFTISARSTMCWSFSDTYCCFRREPSLSSMLKRTAAELSVAEYSLTGIDTRPNERESDAIERAAMRAPQSRSGPPRCASGPGAYGQALDLVTRGVAPGRRLVAKDLHAFADRLRRRPVVRPGVLLLEAQVLARGRDGPLRAALERHQLLPGDRHRDAEARPRSRREGRCRRLPWAVPQVVDEDPADAVAAAAPGDEALGNRLRQMRHDRLRESLGDVVVQLGGERHDDVQALAAARLQPALQAELAQHRAHQERGLLDLRPAHALAGVEVEDDAIRLIDRVRRRVQRVELDRVHLRRRDERVDVVDREHRRVARPELCVEHAQPRDARLGVLLEEQLAGDAIGRADQRHRPVAQVRQDALGDALEVAHERQLGDAGRRIDDAVGVAD